MRMGRDRQLCAHQAFQALSQTITEQIDEAYTAILQFCYQVGTKMQCLSRPGLSSSDCLVHSSMREHSICGHVVLAPRLANLAMPTRSIPELTSGELAGDRKSIFLSRASFERTTRPEKVLWRIAKRALSRKRHFIFGTVFSGRCFCYKPGFVAVADEASRAINSMSLHQTD
jgi:hypothetical protein